jgi:hypothetical protein
VTRTLAVLAILLLGLAGCGGESGGTAPADSASEVSTRILAPDFTLELGDGGSYTLSDGEKPVYLVFWAEW